MHVDGRLSDPDRIAVEETATQPLPTRGEFDAGVAVLSEDGRFGAPIGDGAFVPYAPVPPLAGGE